VLSDHDNHLLVTVALIGLSTVVQNNRKTSRADAGIPVIVLCAKGRILSTIFPPHGA